MSTTEGKVAAAASEIAACFGLMIVERRFGGTGLSCGQTTLQRREVLERTAVLRLVRIEEFKQPPEFWTDRIF